MPTIDSTISQLSKVELIGLFFGLANLVSGLGEASGNFIGGKLLDIGTQVPYLPWLIYGLAGVLIGLIVLWLKKQPSLQAVLQEAAAKANGPKHAPKVSPNPAQHPSHPFDRWEPEVFIRKK